MSFRPRPEIIRQIARARHLDAGRRMEMFLPAADRYQISVFGKDHEKSVD
jgi:hypothetical protein